jgi:hypothetical protein
MKLIFKTPCPNCHDYGGGGYVYHHFDKVNSEHFYVCAECGTTWRMHSEIFNGNQIYLGDIDQQIYDGNAFFVDDDGFSISRDEISKLILNNYDSIISEKPVREHMGFRYYIFKPNFIIGKNNEELIVLLLQPKSDEIVVFPSPNDNKHL